MEKFFKKKTPETWNQPYENIALDISSAMHYFRFVYKKGVPDYILINPGDYVVLRSLWISIGELSPVEDMDSFENTRIIRSDDIEKGRCIIVSG